MDFTSPASNEPPRRTVPGAPPLPPSLRLQGERLSHATSPSRNAPPEVTDTRSMFRTNSPSTPPTASTAAPVRRPARSRRFMVRLWRHKIGAIFLIICLVAAALLALPATRYPILAQAGMRRAYLISVSDKDAHTPVSGASVVIDGNTTTTNCSGSTKIMLRVGKHHLTIRKKYYRDATAEIFVGIKASGNANNVPLLATGRQVQLSIVDKISGKGVPQARIAILDTEARTDANGKATIELPAASASLPATVSADGYNESNVTVQVTDQIVAANNFLLVPAGRVYFLSNQSGTIDVISANLDGSDRKTVVTGTGNEDPAATLLIPSHDWTSLALISKRDSGRKDPKLYIISTKDGKLTTIDSDSGQYTPIGWSDHVFVYQVFHYGADAWLPSQTVLKGFDADANKLATIDQTNAMGADGQYIRQTLAFANIVGGRVVYGMAWNDAYGNYDPNRLGGQSNVIVSADVTGGHKQTLRSFSLSNGMTASYMSAVLMTAAQLYMASSIGGQPELYFSYQPGNNSVSESNTMTDSAYQQAAQNRVSYLVSPTGRQAFWSQARDGKNALMVGNSDGSNGAQIGQPDVYAPFGWLTDNYLLVQKNDSELYVLDVAGGTPTKITDYFKTAPVLYNYGD